MIDNDNDHSATKKGLTKIICKIFKNGAKKIIKIYNI